VFPRKEVRLIGYLMIDHRGGQGLDDKKGILQEFDTASCRHCQAVIKMIKHGINKTRDGFWCYPCAGPICKFCGDKSKGECSPFKKKIEESDRRQTYYRSLGIIAK